MNPEAIENQGQLSDVEKNQAAIDRHTESVQTIAVSDLDTNRTGEFGGVSYESTFRSGKQQPVHIVKLSFPEGETFEVVVRPTSGNFDELYERYEEVRKYFPHLYMKVNAEDEYHLKRKILVVERVEGYEEKSNGQAFYEHVTNEENFEQLCKEVFTAVDELHQKPVLINDVNAVSGHNVFYNTKTKMFHFFDVDSLKESDLSAERKFMTFIENGLRVDAEIKFLVRMIQLYVEKYPEAKFSYEGEEYVKGNFEEVKDAKLEDQGLIRPGSSDYEDAYRSLDWRGTRGRTDLSPLRLIKRKGKDVISTNPELVEAALANDFEKTKEMVEKLFGKITETKFVETKE
jgi:hypothetical protein